MAAAEAALGSLPEAACAATPAAKKEDPF